MWMLCDDVTSYILKFHVCTGKENGENTSTSLEERVVMKLLERYLDKEHKVYFDNFYTSPCLLRHLLQRNKYSSRTARSDRKHFPIAIVNKTNKKKKIKRKYFVRGTCRFQCYGSLTTPVTAVHFVDKRGLKENENMG